MILPGCYSSLDLSNIVSFAEEEEADEPDEGSDHEFSGWVRCTRLYIESDI